MAKYGIDVSDNQGVIDWKKVKNAGVEFAILRSVRRSGKNDYQLENNIKGCIKNGIPADFYKYAYALTEKDSAREANEVVSALSALGIKPSKDVVIWHDVEDDSQMALSTTALTKICNAFREVVEKAGYTYGLYMGKYDFEKGEVKIADLGMPHIWIARYYDGYTLKGFGEKPNAKYKPTVPNGKLWGWQYTSSGRVDGISGNVDLNEVYYDIKELKQEDTKPQTAKKSIDEVAKDVINGLYGNGEIRKKKLETEGYDYETIRARVNQIIEEHKYYSKYNGNSNRVDEVLAAIGVPDIYVGNKMKRKPVGKANGFPNYTGKQNENLAIIYLAKQGKLKKP